MAKVEKDINVSEIIKKKKISTCSQARIHRTFNEINLFIIAGWLLFTQVFMLMRNTGIDMFPSIKDGDLVLAYRLEKDYEREDVVIYNVDGTTAIGRIIACQNDVVMMDESGTLLVNGTTKTGEILYPTYAKEGIPYPYQIPEGCYFILGDYRTQTKDSRDFGSVYVDDIEGKVLSLLRRRGI